MQKYRLKRNEPVLIREEYANDDICHYGAWVNADTAEAEIHAAREEGMADSGYEVKRQIEKAVQRERQEIVKAYEELRHDHLAEESFYLVIKSRLIEACNLYRGRYLQCKNK